MEIEIDLEGTAARARLDPESAPATCAALERLLPFSTTAHYAKIAGDEFMLHLPVVLEVERARPVAVLPRGCVAFWPDRQLFCVYYGRIQEEDATVTVLGQVVDNLDALAAAGERLRRPHGDGHPIARLRALTPAHRAGGVGRSGPAARGAAVARQIDAAYAGIADRVPEEVSALLRARDVMRPAGPLLYAEGDTRTLQEALWLLRQEARATGAVPPFASRLLRHAAGRLRGWYQLDRAAAVLELAAGALPELPAPHAGEMVDALIVYVGRLNLWLDVSIPWNEFNQAFAGSK
ncbi:MAG TPA: DUF3830 family protein [bacterium]|nr:DUF3830 family protein [bacterium]